jgi:hypothetical protein
MFGSKIRFIHYSCRPLAKVCDREQSLTARDSAGAKPIGLWFSVGDGIDWITLCEKRHAENGWCLDVLKYQTEIVLTECANILCLKTAEDIDTFTTKYVLSSDGTTRSINWPLIAKHFGGIIIAPFCAERCDCERTRWYDYWEVSCGCVWQANAVKLLRPLN